MYGNTIAYLSPAALGLRCRMRASLQLRCACSSLRWPLLLQSTGSRCEDFGTCSLQFNSGSHTLAHKLSGCGTWAWLLCSIPRSGTLCIGRWILSHWESSHYCLKHTLFIFLLSFWNSHNANIASTDYIPQVL